MSTSSKRHNPLRFIVSPGQSDPFYCTALGRAVTAQWSEEAFERLLAKTRLQSLTPHTVKSLAEIRQRTAKARQTGFAEENEESVGGVCCLAISLAAHGFPDAAISLAMPVQRLTRLHKARVIKLLYSIKNPHA